MLVTHQLKKIGEKKLISITDKDREHLKKAKNIVQKHNYGIIKRSKEEQLVALLKNFKIIHKNSIDIKFII